MNRMRLLMALAAGLALSAAAANARGASASSSGTLRASDPSASESASDSSNTLTLTSKSLNGSRPETIGSSFAAHTGFGTMGVAATAGPNTLGADAAASIEGTWTGSGSTASQSPVGLTVHFDGTVDPILIRGATTAQIFLSVLLEYSANQGDTVFRFSANYDQDRPEIRATIKTRDLNGVVVTSDVTSNLVIDRLQNTVSYDASFSTMVPTNQWAESFTGDVAVEPSEASDPLVHSINFSSTFSVQPHSLDPNVTFVSDDGRVATFVPEPAGGVAACALLGGCLLARRRRR
jgi:hypothetical protein